MSHWTDSPSYLVDVVAEAFWPIDPDRGGPEAKGLLAYYAQADAMPESDITIEALRKIAAALPNTRVA